MKGQYSHPLEERFLELTVRLIRNIGTIPYSDVGLPIRKQLIRSGTSISINYAEALASESRKDFIHKLQITLKELRETHINLRIIEKCNISPAENELNYLIDECNQLIAITVASINTLKKKENQN